MATLRKCESLVFAHAQVSFHHSGFLHFLETRVSLSKGEPLATISFVNNNRVVKKIHIQDCDTLELTNNFPPFHLLINPFFKSDIFFNLDKTVARVSFLHCCLNSDKIHINHITTDFG